MIQAIQRNNYLPQRSCLGSCFILQVDPIQEMSHLHVWDWSLLFWCT